MTKDEALEVLGGFANYLEAKGTAQKHVDSFRECLAALSSPCACRGEVLAEGQGMLFNTIPGETWIRFFGRSDAGRMEWAKGVRIIILADEPQEGAKE